MSGFDKRKRGWKEDQLLKVSWAFRKNIFWSRITTLTSCHFLPIQCSWWTLGSIHIENEASLCSQIADPKAKYYLSKYFPCSQRDSLFRFLWLKFYSYDSSKWTKNTTRTKGISLPFIRNSIKIFLGGINGQPPVSRVISVCSEDSH